MQDALLDGPVPRAFLAFSWPLVVSNVLQQCYSIVDMFIVGYALGSDALVAVGSTFSLTTCVTAVILGLCMGSGAVVSRAYGARDAKALEETVASSFALVGLVCTGLLALLFLLLGQLQAFLGVPDETWWYMMSYLQIVFTGVVATFLYSFFACLVRAMGQTLVPFLLLAGATLLNIGLDALFLLGFGFGAAGAGWATVVAQYASAGAMALYAWRMYPAARGIFKITLIKRGRVREVARYSLATGAEQAVLGLSALAVQPFVTAAGDVAVAAYAAVVKIEALAISPLQGLGKAFCTLVAMNCGAGRAERVTAGSKVAVASAAVLCAASGMFVTNKGAVLLGAVDATLAVDELRWGMGLLGVGCAFLVAAAAMFLLLGYFRATGAPVASLALALVSMLVRIPVAALGTAGIWWCAPAGWVAACFAGLVLVVVRRPRMDVRAA